MTRMHNPPHPGEVLKDGVFAEQSFTVTGFSEHIGVTRVALSRVLNGKAAVSAEMALRLSAALGGSAESWLYMQANHDLWRAEKAMRSEVNRIRSAALTSELKLEPPPELAQAPGAKAPHSRMGRHAMTVAGPGSIKAIPKSKPANRRKSAA